MDNAKELVVIVTMAGSPSWAGGRCCAAIIEKEIRVAFGGIGLVSAEKLLVFLPEISKYFVR